MTAEDPIQKFTGNDTPGVVFEDDHLLVMRKPAGWNTHSPSPYAGEGLYDWLRHREPRWATLAIHHRLDKETSGVMVFGKTPLANRSLTEQFTRRLVRKTYILVSDRAPKQSVFHVKSHIQRQGEVYVSSTSSHGGQLAETEFRVLRQESGRTWIEARPLTGRTHQIRLQAADSGVPILGDTLYGGSPASRLYLHAHELVFHHPQGNCQVRFETPPAFGDPREQALRRAVIHPEFTNACRRIHGAGDGWPGWQVDRLGDGWLSQSAEDLTSSQWNCLTEIRRAEGGRVVYHKRLDRRVRQTQPASSSPRCLIGEGEGQPVVIAENGLRFELRFSEGYSVGLFLDQRENRRRLLRSHVAGGFPWWPAPGRPLHLLNTFAYTGGFSVGAAAAGFLTVSVDLSAKYLEWARHNFVLNHLPLDGHEFLTGDVMDWLRRFARKQRRFDCVVLDPPTFSTSKKSGVFRVEKDYPQLIEAALAVTAPQGVVLACANSASLPPEAFVETIQETVVRAGRRIQCSHYVPQPPDFPVCRAEPAYLKTLWLRLD